MYKLSRGMSLLLEDYGVAEFGEEVEIGWIIGEAECTTVFDGAEQWKDSADKDEYKYITDPTRSEESVLMWTREEMGYDV